MATSNRDRIGTMLELVAPPLDDFIQDAVSPQLPGDGVRWTALLAARDGKNGISGKTYSERDPQVIFRMLTENIPHKIKPGWYPFDDRLSHVAQSYTSELRDIRNSWAHNASFSDDDTYRALDSAERLLTAIGAADVADQVKRLRLNLRRVTAEKDDRRSLKAAAEENPAAAGLRPWREVLKPHDDVASGNFHAAEFAADLYKVATGDPEEARDYADPVQFFARTYLTDGLRDLISRAVRRLSGDDNASPVINLQTNFGGGKTHSMLSLWHLAGGRSLTAFGQDLQEVLAPLQYDALPPVRRVAIVGNHLAPQGEAKSDGTHVNTIWGELAWQFGGADAYALVAEADRTGTNPGAALHRLLEAYAPAVILIDEWVAYARQLYGRDDLAGGTFDTQFTFAQSLTEAAKGTPGVLLAISIPASDSANGAAQDTPGSAEEVGGTYGLEALKRLQNVVRRVADQWRPASSDEAYHIVRQRLFETPDGHAIAEITKTAKDFVELYRHNHTEFPSEAREPAYEDRIKQCFPIHPELFDRLYQEWSTLERFQRTRGVLRFASTVVHALWEGGDSSPLIMPGSLPLSVADVNTELTQYLSDSWKAIIDADVDGKNSEPVRIDRESTTYGARQTTKRLARTVFFGAAPTIGTALKGIEVKRVFLGTAVPGDVVGNFHSALNLLADRATYFYSGSGKYWYDTQANINRRAKDQAERLHPEDVWAEIRRRLEARSQARGEFVRVNVCPEDSGDILDLDEVTLVILPPKVTHKKGEKDSSAMEFGRKATESRGAAHRTYRNMLVFAAADTERMNELDQSIRAHLGWQDVASKVGELDLTQSQQEQARSQAARFDKTSDDRLLLTYQWLIAPRQPDAGQPFVLDVVKADGHTESIAERATRKLINEGALDTVISPLPIRQLLEGPLRLRWKDGSISVGELWELFAQYPYMNRLRDRSVLDAGVVESPGIVWQRDGFALADGYDDAAGRFLGLALPTGEKDVQVTNGTLLVDIALAQEQVRRDLPAHDDNVDAELPGGAGQAIRTTGVSTAAGDVAPTARPGKTRFYGTAELKSASYVMDLKKIHDEILVHLNAAGSRVRLTLEIEAIAPDGFDDDTVRTVAENAQTLRFRQSGFEES